jgi:hypothetical protein
MAHNDDNIRLVDLLDDENLTDEERQQAEQLLEDDELREEVESHRALLNMIRERLDAPDVSQEVHDDIVDYARSAAGGSADTSASDPDKGGQDETGATVIGFPVSGQTVAVAAALVAVIGGIVFISMQTRQPSSSPSEVAAKQDEQTGKMAGEPQKPSIDRQPTTNQTATSTDGPDTGVLANNDPNKTGKPKADEPTPSGTPDTDVSTQAVGTGSLVADKSSSSDDNTADQGRGSIDQNEPLPKSPTDGEATPREGVESSANNEPSGAPADEESPGTGSSGGTFGAAGTADSPPTSKSKDSSPEPRRQADRERTQDGVALFGDDSSPSKRAGRTQAKSESDRQAAADQNGSEPSNDAGPTQPSSINQRVDEMITAMQAGRADSALNTANALLSDTDAREVQISLEEHPTRSAHYYALEYKLRALIRLNRWAGARTTLAVIRRLYPDAPDDRIRPLANEIPQTDPNEPVPASD